MSSLPRFVRRRRWWILGSVSVVLVCSVTAALLVGYVKYRKVVGEVHHVAVTDLGKRPPVYSTSSENILLVGDDSRSGLDHHQQVVLHTGSDQANNTDTIMVLHISPGRHELTVMSIPRDTMMPYYQCNAGGGYAGQQANPSAYERVNAVLAQGGPSCLWKTVEQQTGIHIDHFMELGMAGFVNVVNDLGGVTVCAPFDVNDPVSGLVLPVGEHHIDGVTALAFWRTREDIGEGSDLQRIQRDQFMAAQIVKATLGSGTLGNPLKLLQVAGDIAPNLTVDSGMSTSDLVSLAESLHGLSARDVQFVTAPVIAWPPDPTAEVGLSQPAADTMFAAIAHDTTIPAGASATPSASAPSASAGTTADSHVGQGSTPKPTSSPSASPSKTPAGSPGPTPSASSSSGIQSLANNNNGITGAAACSSDSSAFQGPDSP
ncbi:MAG TPA: LCP family protein [Trebonia sp.]|nr:LCP family protein [Trebonia sp.]